MHTYNIFSKSNFLRFSSATSGYAYYVILRNLGFKMSNYKISIITPFHNVDMKYFANCAAAMRRQTIGFENIQWIIVVHNSEPQYLPMLQEMFAGDSNVVLEELNNEFRTPSSPRNRGLELVDAPYVGMLDGDDYYADDCFEVVLQNAEETRSDLLCVRREIILESDRLYKMTIKSNFNNTERRTIMENGHWDSKKMFSWMWGFATSYFYSSEMLAENGLFFDKDVLFAEDYLFVLQCITKANKVCYLNQYVGYMYFINSGSMVQNANKPASSVLTYAKGYKTIFETMLKYGINASDTVTIHIGGFSNFVLFSKDMTTQIRQEIKDLIAPFLPSVNQLQASKVLSLDKLNHLLRFANEIILNPEKTLQTVASSKLDGLGVLMTILSANKNTDIARRNDFESITMLEAWQYRMPLTNASFYKPLVDLQVRVGEDKILTEAPTTVYFHTATDVLLPCTDEHLASYHKALDSILRGHNNLLLTQSKPVEKVTIDDGVIDTLNSAIVKAYFKYQYFENGRLTASFASPVETYFAQSDDDYRKLVVEALAKKDMDQLVAMTCEEVVAFFRYIEENWEDILAEVQCTAERREELKEIFSAGFDAPVATKLWPNLQRSVAFGSGEHYEAFQQMKHYTGDLAHNHGYYFTEEAILGKAVADNSDHFECIKNINFYELLPLATDAAPVFWTQVEMSKPYQLIVTNRAGLYRYATDHFICPQKVSLSSIEFTIY